MLAHNTYKKLC